MISRFFPCNYDKPMSHRRWYLFCAADEYLSQFLCAAHLASGVELVRDKWEFVLATSPLPAVVMSAYDELLTPYPAARIP